MKSRTASADLPRDQLDLLIRRLKDRRDEEPAAAEIRPREPSVGPAPLSPDQERLWFLHRLDRSSPAYNLGAVLRLRGFLDRVAFARALRGVVRRHQSLRTRVEIDGLGEPLQGTVPVSAAARLPSIDLARLPHPLAVAEARRLASDHVCRPFDLAQGPLVRMALVDVGRKGEPAEERRELVLSVHHLIADGWSIGIFLDELGRLYRAGLEPAVPELPELPIGYGDFAAWQRERIRSGAHEPSLAYWRERLAGAPVAELPTDRPRPVTPSGLGRSLPVSLDRDTSRRLHKLATAEGGTLYSALLAAFQLLLRSYTGEGDVVVGGVVAGRVRPEVARVIGFFANTLALRTEVDGAASFRDLVRRARATVVEALRHQEVPFAQVVEQGTDPSSAASAAGTTPFFRTVFSLDDRSRGSLRFGDLEGEMEEIPTGTAKFDLTVELADGADGLTGRLEYATDLFDGTTVRRLWHHFAALLTGALAAPERSLAELPLLARPELHQLVTEWNDTAADYPRHAAVGELFEALETAAPDAVALEWGRSAWTRRELGRRARAVAAGLRALGVGPGVGVAVCSERSPEAVVGSLAALLAGGYYLFLDPSYPAARLGFMLDDSGARVLLVGSGAEPETVEALRRPGLAVRTVAEATAEGDGREVSVAVVASSRACLIYTSGSTGRPKGVAIRHRGIARLVLGTGELRLRPDDVMAPTASLSFDASTLEIWGPLLNAGRIVLVERESLLSPRVLGEELAARRVTALFLTTALFHLVAAESPAALEPVRTVLFGGEAADPGAVRRFFASGVRSRLANLYGPTENSTVSTAFDVRTLGTGFHTVPIGRPIANSDGHLLDRSGRPVPLGSAGELCVGGDGLAEGYHRRPALTASAFVPDAVSGRAGARLYRTGDLARRSPQGLIEFLGRTDGQVKIRGHRIEPGEVEGVLAGHPAVAGAAVVAREDRPGQVRLVAFVVLREGHFAGPDELRAHLEAGLPRLMVPVIVPIAELPQTPNGKLDRQALVARPLGPTRLEGDAVAPRNAAEQAIATAFAEVLEIDRVGIHDSFFDLGGHSLKAARVASRIGTAFGVELPLRRLFELQTVARLASALGEGGLPAAAADRRAGARTDADSGKAAGPFPLSFSQERLWFLHRLEGASAAYNVAGALRLRGWLRPAALAAAVGEVCRRHQALRSVFEESDGEPLQRIAAAAAVPLPVVDLSGLAARGCDPDREAERLTAAQARRPFDLTTGPLLRCLLLRRQTADHTLAATLHHIVSDGWSLGVMTREIGEIYAAKVRGLPHRLPPLPLQWPEHAVAEREELSGERLAAKMAFWHRTLDGAVPLDLPADRPRPLVSSGRGSSFRVALGAARSGRLRALARREGVTPFAVLAAAVQSLLGRYTGQSDVLLGFPVVNRVRVETERLIGFFVNTLVLRADLSGDPAFCEVLRRAGASTLDALSHQDLPFDRLVGSVAGAGAATGGPLVQVFLALQNAPRPEVDLPGLEVELAGVPNGTAKFDLTIDLVDSESHLEGVVTYSIDRFETPTVRRLWRHLETLLDAALAAPDLRLSELPLLGPGEQHLLAVEWSVGGGALPAAAPGDDWAAVVRELAERAPDAVAVEQDGELTTYGELIRRAGGLAEVLRRAGIGAEDRVGVLLDEPFGVAEALLGILEAGAVYLPLDARQPAERLASVVADAGPSAVIVRQGGEVSWLGGVPVFAINDVAGGGHGGAREPVEPPAGAEGLAYVIHTSGSTGRPKGVSITRGALAELAAAQAAGLALQPGDRVLQFAPLVFDASLSEIAATLVAGATLILARREQRVPGAALARLLGAWRVNCVKLPPSSLALMPPDADRLLLPDLTRIAVAGEACSPDLPGTWARGRRLLNVYGPTECTVTSSIGELRAGSVVSIGRPIGGRRVRVVDRELAPVPVGVPGELVVAGGALARGYLGRPAATAERFVPAPGGRIYRTGDLVRWLPDGRLQYLGRIDRQVKVRGFRIEPGEVEAALDRLPEIRESVVGAATDAAGDVHLVAWIAPEEGHEVDVRGLRQRLAARLPEYLVPSLFRVVPALPRSTAGKVDRRRLATEAPPVAAVGVAQRPLATATERRLAALFGDLLGVGTVGPDDDFFELGGHSLTAVRLVARIRSELGRELPLRRLFELRTVSAVAVELEEAPPGADRGLGIERRPGRDSDRPAGPFPLSFAQERLWFLHRLDAGSAAYNVPGAVRLRGELRPAALAAALTRLARRHETLRTRFAMSGDEASQWVEPAAPVALPVVDLAAVPADSGLRQGEVDRLAARHASRAFDLETGPLLRCTLLRLAPEEHTLLATLHHIVSDGWSLRVMLNELQELYGSAVAGEPSRLPPLPLQYADYAAAQRRELAGERLAALEDFWRERLAGAAPLELPTDRPRPATSTGRGGSLPLALSEERTRRLRERARQEGVTTFALLATAVQSLLGRYAGRTDVLLGFPVANRDRVETEGLIGFFVNTLVLRTDLSRDHGFREILGQVAKGAVEAIAHQELPFQSLVNLRHLDRAAGSTPLVQVLFALQEAAPAEIRLPGLHGELVGGIAQSAKFDLSIDLSDRGDRLAGALEYDRDLFDPTTVRRLAGGFLRLLDAAVEAPDLPVSRLPLLAPAESHQILTEWAGAGSGYPRAATLAELFARQVRLRPDAVAIEAGRESLSYGALAARTRRLAVELTSLGVRPGDVVALLLDRSVEMVVATLAVVEAGACYAPLDPDYPPERLAFMLEDTAAPVAVVHRHLADRFGELLDPAAGSFRGARLVLDGREAQSGSAEDTALPGPAVFPESAAYVMYTSGSTGRPKGVVVPARAVSRLVLEADFARLDGDETFLHLAPASFDAATLEIWAPLVHGGRLVVAPAGRSGLGEIGRTIAAARITTLWLTAGLFHQMVDDRLADLAGLRQLLAGGDALSPGHVRRVLEELPGVRVINGYGPTENTTFTSCHGMASPEDVATPVPIGRPIADTGVLLLDARFRPVGVGVPGELYAAGDGVARGYLGRPARTAAAFVPHPSPAAPGERLYRTGDLARWRVDGTLEFLGRRDHQVKVRGFRVELGEVEAAIAAHPRVEAVVVLASADASGSKRLIAYAVPVGARTAGDLSPADLRAHLAGRLPAFMVPSAFVLLDRFPLDPNGKVDRRALAAVAPTVVAETGGAGGASDRSPLEEILAGIWADLLDLEVPPEGFGPDADFFELGGHSLLATRLVSRLRELLGVELPLRRVFEAPTVAGVAAAVAELRGLDPGVGEPQIERLPRDRPLPLSFAQERLWFLDRMDPGSTAYNISGSLRLRGRLRRDLLGRAAAALVRRHEPLRTTFEEAGGVPHQRIHPRVPTPLVVVDVAGLPAGVREVEAARLRRRLDRTPFDLVRGPLVRFALLALGPETDRDEGAEAFSLTVVVHHVVSDGWSMTLLLREMMAAYRGLLLGEPVDLPALPVQYADVAAWQRRVLEGDRLEDRLRYWRKALAGAPQSLDLPTDRPRPPVRSFRGRSLHHELPSDLTARVRALAGAEGATPFMVLLAAFGLLLARWSGQEEVLVGSPIAGRTRSDTEGLIGLFLNTLVLRVDTGGEPTFRELVRRVRDTALGAYAHQDLPFERLLDELRPERDLSRTPLFQVFFNMLNLPKEEIRLPDLEAEVVRDVEAEAKFDLTVYAEEQGADLVLHLVYNADLFDIETVAELARQYQGLLGQAVEDRGRRVAELSLVTERVLEVLPDPRLRLDDGWHGPVDGMVRRRAEEQPDAVAVTGGGILWSYAELEARIGRLASMLAAAGIGRGDVVAILGHRTAALPWAILGALRAGAAYTVLDPAYPAARLAQVVEQARPKAWLEVLGSGGTPPELEELLGGLGMACRLRLGSGAGEDPTVGAPAAGSGAPVPAVDGDDLAYLAFTSGSTGKPKGVRGRHGPLSHFLSWQARDLGLGPGDRFSMLSGLAHDPLQRDVFTSLALGATLCVPAGETMEVPGRLAAWIAAEGITTAHLTPAMGRMLAEGATTGFDSLRWALFVGEALTGADVALLRGLAPGVTCINLYGSTETQRAVGWHRVDPGAPGARAVLPVGQELPDVQVLVLAAPGRLAGLGELGEIWVRSPHLAAGYLDDPGLSRERFVSNPFRDGAEPSDPDDRLYRTGDLGRWLRDGRVAFLGRGDQQVKLRGFRIELGEIESVLAAHPEVAEAVVTLREDRPGDPRLVAYVVAREERAAVEPEVLRAHVARRLPVYMVPSAFVALERLPLTPNRKVDRRALPAPDWSDGDALGGAVYEAPATAVEQELAALWAAVLGVERAGRRDDFFALGGHSLLATRVVSRLRESLGVEVPVRALFEAPVLADLAARVEALLATSAHHAEGVPPLEAVPRSADLPLSFAQERLWFLELLAPESPFYMLPWALRLVGPLDGARLERALAGVIARHEVLRTGLVEVAGRPVQRIAASVAVPMVRVCVAGLPEDRREGEVRRLVWCDARRPFDLAVPPLLRAMLVETATEEHALVLMVHHAVSDGWSAGVLVREVAALYEGEVSLPPLPIQYADYAVWQRRWLSGEVLERELGHWRQRLTGSPGFELPTDRPRPAVASHRGATVLTLVPPATVAALRALCARRGASLFMGLLAGFGAVLLRWSGEDEWVVGMPISNRRHPAVEGLIGLFVNTLALRVDGSGNPSFVEWLGRIRERALEAYAHQDVPFEQVVDAMAPARDLSRNPLFQVMCNLQNAPRDPLKCRGISFEGMAADAGTSLFDLSLNSVDPPSGELVCRWEHATDLFDRTTIERLAGHFERVLAAAVAEPELALGSLPLVSAAERQQALVEWNDTAREAAFGGRTVPAAILERAAAEPERVAVSAGVASLSLGELAARSARVAAALRRRGVGPETRVGVALERSVDLLVALLGIWRAGGAYVPMDPAYPGERLAYMAADAGVRLVVTEAGAALPAELVASPFPRVELADLLAAAPEAEVPAEMEAAPHPSSPAYVLYTSGSTGKPKGVVVPHRALANFLGAMAERPGLGPDDGLLAVTSLSFDIAGLELYLPLLVGARVELADGATAGDGAALALRLAASRATAMQATPSTWRMLAAAGWQGSSEVAALAGGEALPEPLAEWLAACSRELWNLYGPTETTVWSSVARIAPGDRVSLGRPVANTAVRVLGPRDEVPPVSGWGELHLGGEGLARGYLGRPALTAERFVPDPGAGAGAGPLSGSLSCPLSGPGARLYRTGDRARWLPDGRLDFAGRLDHQVKVRGHRIELGEIESALAAHPAVAEAVVAVREDRPGDPRLVAYVVPREPEAPPDSESLRSHLGSRLPAYMVPSAYVTLERLPLTPNRKVDRRALPAPDWSAGADPSGAEYEAPANAVERELAALWSEVLGVERVSRTAGFFALGGHSLLATELVARVATAFGVALPLRTVFQASTVAAMAEVVAELREADPAAREVAPAGFLPTLRPDPASRHEAFPLTEVQEAYWVGRSGAVELGSVASHVYLELALPDLDPGRLARAWRRLVARHDMLRAVVLSDGRQRILPEVPPYEVRTLDLSSSAPAEVEAGLAEVRAEMSHQVLPAERWPLFDLRTTRLPGGGSRIHFSVDLLIADAWSFRVVGREMAALYRDPEAELPPLELSFRDYVLAERSLREGAAHERALQYWRHRLETLPPAPELPLAKDPAAVTEPKFVRRSGRLEPARWARLKERAARVALTPSSVLLAAFAEALATWSKSPRFTINLTLFNRLPLHPEVNQVVGDFTSLTLLEVDRSEPAPFETCAQRVQERLWQDLDHRLVSGVRVLRELARAQGGGRRAYMPVVFTSVLNQSEEGEESEAGADEGARPEVVYSISQTPQVWLDHQVSERGGALIYNWDAVEELFPAGLLDDLFAAYSRFVERLAEDDAVWTAEPQCLVPAAQLARQAAVNATAAPLPEGLLHDRFLARAAERPAAPAVVAGGRTVTYGELLRGSRRLGERLRRAGARPNRLVAVAMEKGWEQVLAVLAILQSGGAYLPVDPSLPAERRRFLLESGEVELVLVQPRLADLDWPPGVSVLPVDEALLAAGEEPPPLEPAQAPHDLAYVIFTSGSTGRPKGVMIDHRGALNTVADVNSRFGIEPADRVLGVSSLSFDLSVWDVFGTLAAGATLVLPEPQARRDPARWAELIAAEQVSVWNSAPALMEMLVEYAAGAEVDLASLRLALLSGDWIPLKLPGRIRALAPGARVVSLGGATEGSIWSIFHPVDRVDPDWASIPYGRPMTNQTFHVLDHRLAPRPDWTPGELYIGGAGVALGYWRDPERTAAAFVTHPETGERLYRTGDLGRYRPGGEIEFLGREDFQVQLQGHRVELGEIEAALLDHPGVRAAVVDAVGDPKGAKRLVAYVVVAGETALEPAPGLATEAPALVAQAAPAPAAAPDAHAAEHLRFKLSEPGLRRDAGRRAVELPVDGTPEQDREIFLGRRSHRRFTREPASAEALSRLLGCLRQVRFDELPFPKYRYPSAGNLYPVQTYVHVRPGRFTGLAGGLYYHDPKGHRLVELAPDVDLGPEVHVQANRQLAGEAAFSIFLVARAGAIEPVYGDLARDFSLLEAGAMSQLLMTEAAAAGLGLCPIGSVAFDAIRPHFALDEDHELLHALVGGVPAGEAAAETVARPAVMADEAAPDLRTFLERKLPAHMVPASLVRLDALPLTANGKLDRKALPAPALAAPGGERREVPPASDLERVLAELWSELLGVESVGVHDNFFELGGTSVALVRAYNRLQQHLAVEIPIVELFEHPTIHSLARHLGGGKAAGAVRDLTAPTEPAPEAEAARERERGETRRSTRTDRRLRRRRARGDVDQGDPHE